MKHKTSVVFRFSSAVLALGIVSLVSGSFLASKEAAAKQESKAAKKANTKQEAKAGSTAKLAIASKGDELVFDKATLTAKAGQTIQLTFTNRASKGSGLQHNIVVVKPGMAEKVANEGIQAGPDKNWTPVGSPNVLASSKMINPGESETLTFKAPSDPGDYPYVCTFPGHWTTMKGVLKVTK